MVIEATFYVSLKGDESLLASFQVTMMLRKYCEANGLNSIPGLEKGKLIEKLDGHFLKVCAWLAKSEKSTLYFTKQG